MEDHEQTDFIKTVVAFDLLDDAIEWIKDNLQPDEVFAESKLAEWAEYNLQPDEVFSTSELVEWAEADLCDYCSPDDVFSESDLGEWAEENGYVERK